MNYNLYREFFEACEALRAVREADEPKHEDVPTSKWECKRCVSIATAETLVELARRKVLKDLRLE